jgi:hypothetical protein
MPVEAITTDGVEGTFDARPLTCIPSSSMKVIVRNDAEGAFVVRPSTYLPNTFTLA